MKRACIYFIYDKDGIIDQYVLYQIRALREHVEFLHCVINGNLTDEGKRKLSEIADQVYIRENKGNDIGAYKSAISYIGWSKLDTYDELILMNNTCFGPIYPLQEVFDWSVSQNVEIWGFTLGLKVDWLNGEKYLHWNDLQEHIQSYFLALRKPLLGSSVIKEFFDDIPEDTSYVLSGCIYEYAFPGYFSQKGYKWAVYCNSDDYNYPLLHNPIELVKKFRMPFFKKRSFFHHYTDVLHNTCGEATIRLLRFIEQETEYDSDMIWEAILRTCNLSDIVRCVQLNRILHRDNVMWDIKSHKLKVGAVFHAFYEDLFDESLNYLKNLPQGAGLLLTTNSESKRDILIAKLKEKNMQGTVKVIGERGRDVSSLLVGAKDFILEYDLICFAHDKKVTQVQPHNVGRSWSYKINENLFASKDFVNNVITMFEREERLGIAFPSYPNHNAYASILGTGWTNNFSNTKKLLEYFGIHVKLNPRSLCVAPLGTCFWFRTKALKELFEGYEGNGWSYSDFPREPIETDGTILHAIERAYAYFAQAAGFYPVFLYNDKFAEIELTNLEFNKVGSIPMQRWMDEDVRSSLYDEKSISDENQEEDMNKPAVYDYNYNFGCRESLRHLAVALRHKFPFFWSLLWPIRRIGQYVLGIETNRDCD